MNPTVDIEHIYNSKKPFRTLIKMLNIKLPKYFGYFILFFAKYSPELLTPLYLKEVIAFAGNESGRDMSSFIVVNLIYFLVCIQNILTHSLFTKKVHGRVRKMEQGLRSSLTKRLQQLSIAFHTKTQTGRLQSKLLRDVDDITNVTIQLFHQGFATVMAIIWCLFITFRSDWIVGIFFLFSAPLTAILINFFRGKMKKNNEGYRKTMEKMSSRVSEMINTIPITRAHGVEQDEIDKTEENFSQVYRASMKLDFTNQMFGSSSWVLMKIAIMSVMMFSGILAFKGKMEVENVVLYYGLFQIIVGAFSSAMNFIPIFTKGFEAFKSLGEILECPDLEKNRGKKQISNIKGSVIFNNVGFSYDDYKPAICEFNAKIEPGQCTAFVGESGSGKSTLMNLLIGFWRPNTGSILLDGFDYNELDLRSWRKNIAVVPQNTILFSGTILENITYGKSNVKIENIEKAITASNLRGFIDNLEHGLQTVISENGKDLSGGQRQRISIARAILRDPQIIILDEATSALDVVSEKEVQDAIDNLIKGRTTFIVAHRLSTIRNADKVFVMKDGVCIEEGSQVELINKKGEFARLKTLQE